MLAAPTISPTKFSNTRLQMFQRCRQQYWYNYVAREKGKATPWKWQLGCAGHAALAAWYRTGDRYDAIHAAHADLAPAGKEQEHDWEKLIIVLNRYFDWTAEHDDWTVLAVEQEVSWKSGRRMYHGIIDLVIDDNASGQRLIVDHKFSESVRTNHLTFDPQASMYLMLFAGRQKIIDGMMFNYVRMTASGKAEQEPVERNVQLRERKQLNAFLKEMSATANEIELFHRGQLAKYRNFQSSCSWDCPFVGKCLSDWEMGQ